MHILKLDEENLLAKGKFLVGTDRTKLRIYVALFLTPELFDDTFTKCRISNSAFRDRKSLNLSDILVPHYIQYMYHNSERMPWSLVPG